MNDDLGTLIDNFLDSLLDYLPRIGFALIVIVIGLIVAWIIKIIVRRFILFLDSRINEKLQRNLLRVDLISSARMISKTVFWILVALTVAMAVRIAGLHFMDAWFGNLINYVPNIIAALVIVLAGIILGRLVGDILSSAATRTGLANVSSISRLVRYLIQFVAIIIAIDQVGIDVAFLTTLLTILAAAVLFGAALSFALGSVPSVKNILGSYYVQKRYQEGETVRIGDVQGVITKITESCVYLATDDGQVIIPAGKFNEENTIQVNLE